MLLSPSRCENRSAPTRTRRGLRRFPRPYRYVARRFVFPVRLGVGKPMASDLAHCQLEAISIGSAGCFSLLAVIVTKYLFVDVA